MLTSNQALELDSAVVLFGQFPALSGVDLNVNQGEIVMISGPNGAGKTTLLCLLAGLVSMSFGKGEVQGIDLASRDKSELYKRVGLVSNNTMLYEDLTVLENLNFFYNLFLSASSPSNWTKRSKAKKKSNVNNAQDHLENEASNTSKELNKKRVTSKEEINERLKDTLEYIKLPRDSWKLPIRKLSTGQKRRVVLALQILRRPRLWLLDEPHAGLDEQGRNLLDETLKNATQKGATVVLASHEIDRATQLADRRLELKGGRF